MRKGIQRGADRGGVGQGIGSMSFSFASLGYGYVIALLGADWLIWILLIFSVFLIVVVLGYPKISDGVFTEMGQDEALEEKKATDERVSIQEFFGKYKLFVCTLFGVMLVSMCHTMSENYFIAIFESIGGGSENVGVAMFIGCFSAAPFFMFFEKLQKRIDIRVFLKRAGIFFLLKTIIIIFATQTWHIYVAQLLQTVTYGFLYQPLYYLAKQRVSEADLVKGQAVAVAIYALGSAFGSFVGGRAIDLWGIKPMLWLALAIAFTGTMIIHGALGADKKLYKNSIRQTS